MITIKAAVAESKGAPFKIEELEVRDRKVPIGGRLGKHFDVSRRR